MAAELWLVITLAVVMAFQAIGLTEEQTRYMELAVRGLIDEARRGGQQVIAGLTSQVQSLSTSRASKQRSAALARTPDSLDTRLGKPDTSYGKEAKWESWHFKFGAYMTSFGGSYPAMLAAAETSQTVIQLSTLGEDHTAARKILLALVILTGRQRFRGTSTAYEDVQPGHAGPRMIHF